MNAEIKNINAYRIWQQWAGLKGDIRELEGIEDEKTIARWKKQLAELEAKFKAINK